MIEEVYCPVCGEYRGIKIFGIWIKRNRHECRKEERKILTLTECRRRVIDSHFKKLELTSEEFAQFMSLIEDMERIKIDFKTAKWHGVPIKIIWEKKEMRK